MKFREYFATAATCHYLLPIVPTTFLITSALGQRLPFSQLSPLYVWRFRRPNSKFGVYKAAHSKANKLYDSLLTYILRLGTGGDVGLCTMSSCTG